jgi:hypothetical protein
MEEKTITIKMKGPRPERRVLTSWKFWAFIAGALLVAVCEAIDGNWLCVIWVIVAATYAFFADLFKAYSEDFHELNIDLIKERKILLDALKEKDNKIAELQTENISLRFGKTSKQ